MEVRLWERMQKHICLLLAVRTQVEFALAFQVDLHYKLNVGIIILSDLDKFILTGKK